MARKQSEQGSTIATEAGVVIAEQRHVEAEAPKSIGERIRDWDDAVEDGDIDDETAPRRPFDAGIMLAVASVLDAYAAVVRGAPGSTLAAAMSDLRESAEAVIDD